MDQFEAVMSKHGEHGIQAILENWERYMGIRYSSAMTLEERWERFLSQTNDAITQIAA